MSKKSCNFAPGNEKKRAPKNLAIGGSEFFKSEAGGLCTLLAY